MTRIEEIRRRWNAGYPLEERDVRDLLERVERLKAALQFVWPALRRCGYSDESQEIRTIDEALEES